MSATQNGPQAKAPGHYEKRFRMDALQSGSPIHESVSKIQRNQGGGADKNISGMVNQIVVAGVELHSVSIRMF